MYFVVVDRCELSRVCGHHAAAESPKPIACTSAAAAFSRASSVRQRDCEYHCRCTRVGVFDFISSSEDRL